MGVKGKVESCGRCAMSAAVSLTGSDEDDGGYDPYEGEAIEVAEGEVRAVSRHVVALGKVKTKLDEWATSLTYGR